MSEIEDQSSEQKAKICQLSIWALLLSILGIFTFGVTSVIGLILAVIADRRICKSKGGLRGRVYTTLAVITAIIILVRMTIPTHHPRREIVYRMICGDNLSRLGKAMQTYASDYDNKYPTTSKWCDLLLQHAGITEKQLVCISAFKKGNQKPCHYAINPNCEPNSPDDIVLLFETKGGWNQFGGPELLTTENHRGNVCIVLFNDGHVEFVKTEQLGELKWANEEKDSESIE